MIVGSKLPVKKATTITLWLSMLLSVISATGQPPREEHAATLLTRFSFRQLSSGGILLRGTLSNFPDSLNFILDTGSGGISLDSARATFFNLPLRRSGVTVNGIGGQMAVPDIRKQTLHLPGLTIDSLPFHIADYGLLSTVYGEKIDGVIGFALLRRYVIQVDFDALAISFFSPGRFAYPKRGYHLNPAFMQQPLTPGNVRDERSITSRFLFDSGADLALLLSEDFVRDSAVLKKGRKYFLKQGEGLGGTINLRLCVISEFRLGPYKFKDVPTYLLTDQYNVLLYPRAMGLIGNHLLCRFNLVLNYAEKEIHLTPNTHFQDPFSYAYTGMNLWDDNGTIRIGNIAKDSPAETAGLRQNDQVISLDGVDDQIFGHYKTALEAAVGKIGVTVKRADHLIRLTIRVEDINQKPL